MRTVPTVPASAPGGSRAGVIVITCAAAIALLAACASAPAGVPPDLSPAKLVQRAQEASDQSRYAAALQYYEAIRERFPNDLEYRTTADYEIAFIHYKQKRFAEARDEFAGLLARYAEPGAELLPAQFGILARKMLEKIDAKAGSTATGSPAASGAPLPPG